MCKFIVKRMCTDIQSWRLRLLAGNNTIYHCRYIAYHIVYCPLNLRPRSDSIIGCPGNEMRSTRSGSTCWDEWWSPLCYYTPASKQVYRVNKSSQHTTTITTLITTTPHSPSTISEMISQHKHSTLHVLEDTWSYNESRVSQWHFPIILFVGLDLLLQSNQSYIYTVSIPFSMQCHSSRAWSMFSM